MLSRVADSLYWMSRYLERANNSARVIDATWNLMLNPSRFSGDDRWCRALAFLGSPILSEKLDSQEALLRMAASKSDAASIFSCITSARENASQAREEISSEMWEQLNRVYHEVMRASAECDIDTGPLEITSLVREGAFTFKGMTDATMNHGEGYRFLRLGKYTERACSLSYLLDAYFSSQAPATDLDWVGLLSSCAAFEAYCKEYTADLRPERVAEFILLNAEFPYSVRYSADQIRDALEFIAEQSQMPRSPQISRMAGKLQSSLAYVQIEEVMAGDFHLYLNNVIDQCRNLHAAMHEAYIEYPIEMALEN